MKNNRLKSFVYLLTLSAYLAVVTGCGGEPVNFNGTGSGNVSGMGGGCYGSGSQGCGGGGTKPKK